MLNAEWVQSSPVQEDDLISCHSDQLILLYNFSQGWGCVRSKLVLLTGHLWNILLWFYRHWKEVCGAWGGGSMLFRYHDIDLKLFFYKKSFQLWKCRERNLLTLQNVLFKNKNLTCIFFCTPLRGWINCFSFFSFCSFKVFNLGAGPYRKACPCVFVAARKTLQRVCEGCLLKHS